MNSIPDTMSTEAELLRCGFSAGYFDKADIARWADLWILALDEPCSELFDLSLNRRFNPIDLMNLLRSLVKPEHISTVQTTIGFLGLLYGSQKISAQHAIRQLFLLVYEPEMNKDERSQIYYLDDGYDLAAEGSYGTMSEIEHDLSQFVSPYVEQLRMRHPELIAGAG